VRVTGKSKSFLYQSQHFASNAVRRESKGLGKNSRTLTAEAGTILHVKVPVAGNGLVTVHQNVAPQAHAAVKRLHAQLIASVRPFREILLSTEEVAVIDNAQRHPGVPGDTDEYFLDAPLTGFGNH
jgi:hypothetical protein